MERPVEFNNYSPFGSEFTTDVLGTDQKLRFTGHERDLMDPTHTTDDLDSMHARHYNLNLARFLSVDPVGGDPFNPQSWNGYAYVLNNPLKYTDPFGLTISFNDTQAEDAFWDYWNSLDPASIDMQNLMELEDSEIEFQIVLTTGSTEGSTRFDGSNVLVNVRPTGDFEHASIKSRFAHELQHAIQVNEGRMAFIELSGNWRPFLYDLMDEVEAHHAQLRNATSADLEHPKMSAFRDAMGARRKAGVLEPYYIKNKLKGKFSQLTQGPITGVASGTVFRSENYFARVP